MADRTLKVVDAPQAKSSPDAPAEQSAKRGPFARMDRARLRKILLIGIPALALVIGAGIYFAGGRYISTDNAYVGAQKVLVTPDVSGKVIKVLVHEGQRVNPGDELFELDPQPYRLALAQAEAKLADAKIQYNNLKTNLASLTDLGELARKNVELKKADVERKMELLQNRTGAQAAVDTSAAALVAAQLQSQYAAQQRANTLNQLRGDANLPLEQFPAYEQAQATVAQAKRDLDHTVLRAPIEGIATQVDNIQLGRFVTAGGPVFSIIDDSAPWVEANPKETDITHLRIGQKVEIDVDSFPSHTFRGTVQSVSPGTGSQFSILPAQNASGNWVKVVQRVPVRIVFDKTEDLRRLRSGMSATVAIDTGYSRLPFVANAAPADK
jgi:membrane fusion protein (multidrug efflux system)